MPSITDALRRAFGLAPRRRVRSKPVRQVAFEKLEPRNLLAGDVLASISGTVLSDVTANGPSFDDAPIPGANVQLFRDGGNGVFENGGGDDSLLTTKTTNGSGVYRFDGVDAGTYFVRQQPVVGFFQAPGSEVQQVIVSAADLNGRLIDPIDRFETAQDVAAPPTAKVDDSDAVVASEAIGGVRELQARLDTPTGQIQLTSNEFGVESLFFSSSVTAIGGGIVRWDGDLASTDATGLGSYDATGGGSATGVRLALGADLNGGQVKLRMYSDAGNWSEAVVSIPNTGGVAIQSADVAFSQFQAASGSGADFENIGAIELEILGVPALDVQLQRIDTFGPVVHTADFANLPSLSLGNLVWFDANNSGQLDSGESGIGDVLVNLYGDADGNGALTNGVDNFITSAVTNSGGFYGFSQLTTGAYVVQIDPSNFVLGGVLEGLSSSLGTAAATDPDNNIDGDDNGAPLNGQGVVSRAVDLSSNAEPTDDGDGANGNLTVDFGFALFDLSIDKSADVAVATAGQPITYSLDVRNDGPAGAAEVLVVDTLPAGVTFVSASTTKGSVIQTGPEVRVNIGDLASGAEATVTIVADVKPTVADTLVNAAEVSGIRAAADISLVGAPFIEADLSNNQDALQTPVENAVDLEITKIDSDDPVTAGEQYSYILDVRNNGPSTATGVTVVDPLPAGLSFVSASSNKGSVSHSAGVVTADLGTMSPDATAAITINVLVDANAAGTLTNEATVSANENDVDPSNNQDDEETRIRSEFDLQVVKTDAPDPVMPGGELVYTIVATNNGPSDATDVIVSDSLPMDKISAVVSVDTTRGVVTESGGTVTADLGYMAVGDTVTITIVTIVSPSATGTLENTALISGNPAPAPGELSGFGVETDLTNNEDEVPTQILVFPPSIAGYVYLDFNDDGIFDRAGSEAGLGLAGVEIVLSGTTTGGAAVNMVTTTDANGFYEFELTQGGVYSVAETQPAYYRDGQDTPGIDADTLAPIPTTVADDVFSDINLLDATDGIEFNFGERLATKRAYL